MDDITPWSRKKTDLHADCQVYNILKEHWENPDHQSEGDFYVMEVGDWAVCVALTEEGNCVLVRQFRFGAGDFTWELPAGVVEPNEDPVLAGARELHEETGYKGQSVQVLGVVHPNPAIQRNRCYITLVTGARKIDEGNPGPHEFIEVTEVPVETLYDYARDGTITHAIVHTALFFLRDHLEGHSQVEKPSAAGGK